MSAEISVQSLTKAYDNVDAVRGINLDVFAGEIFGLLGPNGAGKTTTIECMLGLRQPDAGTITIAGIDAIAHPQKVKPIIGAQLQATALQDQLTPREAIRFFGAFYGNAIKPDQLLNRFDLAEKANAPFVTLSTGQQQRLALALAFVNDPRVLFLDEPTAGLDPQARHDLHGHIRQMKTDGRTVLLSTHYIEEAEQLCDRVAIINHGQIAGIGTPGELIARAGLPQKVSVLTEPMLSEANLQTMGKVARSGNSWQIATEDVSGCVIGVVKLIEAANAKLIDLKIHRLTLEDAFLKLTQSTP